MKKILITVAVAVTAIVEVGLAASKITKDKVAPEIHIYQEDIVYGVGCSDGVILSGVVAHDEEDGDVSDTIEIVSRSIIVENYIEAVTISACDKSGNVATTKVIFVIEADNTFKILDYDKYEVDMENLEFSIDGAELSGKLEGFELTTSLEDVTLPAGDEEESGETTETEPVETTPQESYTEEPTSEEETTETLSIGTDGKPVIVLKDTEITVTAGSSQMIYVNSIEEILDDKDSSNYLFRRVMTTQNINLSVPGDYEQGIYCRDSDGNRSDIVKLIVHVK